jgi:hypothetical protein
VVALSNSSGDIVERYEYDVFGAPTPRRAGQVDYRRESVVVPTTAKHHIALGAGRVGMMDEGGWTKRSISGH